MRDVMTSTAKPPRVLRATIAVPLLSLFVMACETRLDAEILGAERKVYPGNHWFGELSSPFEPDEGDEAVEITLSVRPNLRSLQWKDLEQFHLYVAECTPEAEDRTLGVLGQPEGAPHETRWSVFVDSRSVEGIDRLEGAPLATGKPLCVQVYSGSMLGTYANSNKMPLSPDQLALLKSLIEE